MICNRCGGVVSGTPSHLYDNVPNCECDPRHGVRDDAIEVRLEEPRPIILEEKGHEL